MFSRQVQNRALNETAMSAIGPELPPHLLKRVNNVDDGVDEDAKELGPALPTQGTTSKTSSIGPQFPTHLIGAGASNDNDEEDDDYVPALPPSLAASRAGGSKPAETSAPSTSQRRVLGPSLPGRDRYEEDDDDDSSDDDFGPMPPPAHGGPVRDDGMSEGVREFLAREERMQKAKEVRGLALPPFQIN